MGLKANFFSRLKGLESSTKTTTRHNESSERVTTEFRNSENNGNSGSDIDPTEGAALRASCSSQPNSTSIRQQVQMVAKLGAGRLIPGPQVLGKYYLVKFLGEGSFADVWLCQDVETLAQVAVKVIDISANGRWLKSVQDRTVQPCTDHGPPGNNQFSQEANKQAREAGQRAMAALADREEATMKLLSGKHDNIMPILSSYSSSSRVELVMQFCQGNNLTHLLDKHGRIPEAAAKDIFRQVVSAVSFCHSHRIVHRDIKLDNILFDLDPYPLLWSQVKGKPNHHVKGSEQPRPMLGDFGAAIQIPQGQLLTGYSGTRFFFAPEITNGLPYDLKVDIWSLGIVLYSMLTGSLPPEKGRCKGIDWFWYDIEKGKANLQMLSGIVSPRAMTLIKVMLTADSNSRISADAVLHHPWLFQE